MTTESTYRRDIDGLRAIAVLSVIGFHAGIRGFSGGFLGVDVFFVISGFLIGGIIFRAVDRDVFSFRDFYVRRVNRIFPALLTVLVATAILGWMFMLPNELAALGKHIIGGATFSSNFILAKEYGYFDLPDKPLLHLWSLAVEEQFYLFFPVFAAILAKIVWKRRFPLVCLIALSFLFNVWQVRHSQQNEAFFLPAARMWEILAGALLADLELQPHAAYTRIRATLGGFAPAAALVILVSSIVLLDEKDSWPGTLALLPIVATVVLIGGETDSAVGRLLSHRALVAVGLISYPLYLWHWPLLVIGKMINEGPLTMQVRLVLIVASFALATVTFHYIEKPIRFGRRKKRSAAALLPALACIGVVGGIVKAGIIYGRLDNAEAVAQRRVNPEPELPRDGTVDGGRKILFSHIPGDDTRIVALYGDSHMQQYWPRFVALAQRDTIDFPTVANLVYGGCPPVPGINRIGVSWDNNPWNCPGVFAAAFDYLMRPEVKIVVISAFWEDYILRGLIIPSDQENAAPLAPNDPGVDEMWNRFEGFVSELTNSGKKVFVILPGPVSRRYGVGISYHDRVPPRLRGLFRNEVPKTGISKSEFLSLSANVRERLIAIATRAGASTIDPVKFLCGEITCPVTAPDGSAVFRDDNHLRLGFVRKYVTYLDPVIR